MSIENKIEQLIVAIDQLTKTIQLSDFVSNDPAVKSIPTTKDVPEPPPMDESEKSESAETTEKEVTHDELKKYCLEKVREDPKFKDELAAAMDGFGVKVLSKLKPEHVQTLAKMVGMV